MLNTSLSLLSAPTGRSPLKCPRYSSDHASSNQRCGKAFIHCTCRLIADGVFCFSPLSLFFHVFGAANAKHGEHKHGVENEDRKGDCRAVRGEVDTKCRVNQVGLDEGSEIDTIRRNTCHNVMSKCSPTMVVLDKTRCYHRKCNRNQGQFQQQLVAVHVLINAFEVYPRQAAT